MDGVTSWLSCHPVALAIGIAPVRDGGRGLQCFSIRKQAKVHGRGKLIEGNFAAGDTVVVVDDTITTGGSTLEAIEKIRLLAQKRFPASYAYVINEQDHLVGVINMHDLLRAGVV